MDRAATGTDAAPPPVWGWGTFPHPAHGAAELHLIPLLDIYAHAFDEDCPCGAVSDCPGSVIHFSYDGREAYEHGCRKRH